MKFLITESELNRFIVNYMNFMYNPDDLEVIRGNDKYSTLYKKDGVVVMEKDLEYDIFSFDYDIIWSYFSEDLNISHDEIVKGLYFWLKTEMNISGFWLSDKLLSRGSF